MTEPVIKKNQHILTIDLESKIDYTRRMSFDELYALVIDAKETIENSKTNWHNIQIEFDIDIGYENDICVEGLNIYGDRDETLDEKISRKEDEKRQRELDKADKLKRETIEYEKYLKLKAKYEGVK